MANLEFQFVPLVRWPHAETRIRKSAPFRATYGKTLMLLEKELAALKARAIVIQIALVAEQIRIDGRPRSTARPTAPGIILSFDSRHGPLSYPCDTYKDWEDNLRAIALSLEHLRAVDRYGVTRRGEQYSGWKALPKPDGSAEFGTTEATPATEAEIEEAYAFLQQFYRGTITNHAEAKTAFRAGSMQHHADREGRDQATFDRLQEINRRLKL